MSPTKTDHDMLPPVILIDDDEEDLMVIREIFQELGCKHPLISFNDPIKAFSYFQVTNDIPLFILCDINLPKMDGFTLRSLILQSCIPLLDVPFFLLSTSRSVSGIERAKSLRISEYYEKPGSFTELSEILQQILVKVTLV